jgi:hypothetical protein
MFRFLALIESTKIVFLGSPEIWVPYSAERALWMVLLPILLEILPGLVYISLGRGQIVCFHGGRTQVTRNKGGCGNKVLFVPASAMIQGLKKLNIHDCYAKRWPLSGI